MSNLFIPAKIRIGFQKREGTYTGKLAYVIYYDQKGKLRKEKSWQGWRDDEIEPVEFDNTPQDGFVLNKGITRYPWSSFGSNRSMIRVYDSRDIEFEVTPENLLGVLMETNCIKRTLEGEFVYAWCGTELLLLPCCSEEYQQAVENTERQGMKVSARDLKQGCSYRTKKGEDVVYMGRFPWFVWDKYEGKGRLSKKKHIFVHAEKPSYGSQFFPKGDAFFLAACNSEEPVQNYADLVDKFNADVHSSPIKGWKTRAINLDRSQVFATQKPDWRGICLKRHRYTTMKGDLITFWHLATIEWGWNDESKKGKIRGYRLEENGTLNTKTLVYSSGQYHRDGVYADDGGSVLSEDKVLDQLGKFVEVDAILHAGNKRHVTKIGHIAPGPYDE